MEKNKYIVHSDVNENNIYKEFDNRDEAIQYAKDHIDDKTWVDLVIEDESGLVDEPDYLTIWTYHDEGAYDMDFPKSDLEDLPDDWIEDTTPADWDDVNRFPNKTEELNIKKAVNKLEENESEVECKCCFDLFPKEACIKTEDGYVCQKCNQELHSHQGTNLDLIDADPFDLSYDDPRDPEEIKEVEIKDAPTNATEIRKHEKAIEETLEEGILDNHKIAKTIKDYKVIRWKYDKASSPKGYKIDALASKPVYGDLKTAEKYAKAWAGVQDEQPNYRRAGIFAVKPGVEETRLNAIQNTDFARVKDSWKNPLDLPQNHGYPELMLLYVLTYDNAKHSVVIYPNSDKRVDVANILRNMKNTSDLTDEKSGEEKGAKVVKPENATIDAAAKDLGSGNKFKLEVFDGEKYADAGMPKAKFEDVEEFFKKNPLAGTAAYKVKAINTTEGTTEVTIAAYNKRNPDKNNNARLQAFVKGKIDALKESLNESQSQEIGDTYKKLSKLYNVNLEDLVYGEGGFMKSCYPEGFPDFAGDVIYSEKYWTEFENWLKEKGIILDDKDIKDLSEIKLDEHINEEHPAIESDQVLQGTDNAVVDCPVAKVIAHSEDEKPLDCKMEKPALEEPLAGKEIDIKINEELDEKEIPWILQQGEDGEPEFIGWAKSEDDLISQMVTNHLSDIIYENTYINELDKETYEYMKKDGDLSEDEIKELDKYFGITEELVEAKKDDELPVDPEAAKLEVHTMLNNLVADEIEAVNGYEEAKAEILDAPIAHKDIILDKVDHIEDEEKEHIDELIDATTEIPFDKEEASAPVVEEPAVESEVIPEEPVVEEGYEDPFYVDFPKNEEKPLVEVAAPLPFDSDVKVGDKIKIIHLTGENNDYDGKEGTVDHIDSIGQLHGTWGGLAVIPGVDEYEVVNEELKESKSFNEGVSLDNPSLKKGLGYLSRYNKHSYICSYRNGRTHQVVAVDKGFDSYQDLIKYIKSVEATNRDIISWDVLYANDLEKYYDALRKAK